MVSYDSVSCIRCGAYNRITNMTCRVCHKSLKEDKNRTEMRLLKKRGLISEVNFYASQVQFETVPDITEKNTTIVNSFNSNIQKETKQNSPNFLTPEKPNKTQFYFPPGAIYESKMFLINTIRQAKKSISIIDKYLDYEVLKLLEDTPKDIEINLLTLYETKSFNRHFGPFTINRKNVTAKKNNRCHDRFIILDSNELWHLGTSLNSFGKDAFMVTKIIEVQAKQKFLKDYKDWWNNG